ncbi:hypothetical protein QYS48_28550 [Marivirga arenosa]|uniref:WG repeat-containing protein n=1 Tax=Marivirga arenosa TaxID=3059076 RepID=A0AA51N759_9BACT|nr:WG repeat-containing protein [Marivirga sp. ABR2-2]WMN07338.1 hypothetical protein QYS48_28550 [Marivirga sp. ABR2-2]
MRQLYIFLYTLFFSFLITGCAYKVLNADKFLEEEKMAKAKARIDKAYDKNNSDPTTHYMLAKYFSHPIWNLEAIDSAHYHINVATDSFPNLNIKKKETLAKKDFDSLAIVNLGKRIDSLAFEKSDSIYTEESFNHYLKDYRYLLFEEEATKLRNQIAYDNAIAQNTPQAVSEFFKKYPNATQAQKARDVFETLYYEKKTKLQRLNDYIEYVEERPQTEFAEDAVFQILNIMSAGADKSDYQKFISQYSNFEAADLALSILNGLNYSENSSEILTHKKDSLYYLFDLQKEELLPFYFSEIMPDSCFIIQRPFVLTGNEDSIFAYLKNGEKLSDKNIVAIKDFNNGFFEIEDATNRNWIEHYSNKDQLNYESLDFQKLDDFHFAKKVNSGWQLTSVINEDILKNPVDSIWIEGELFFLKKGNDLGIASRTEFKKISKSDFKNFSYLYDDYEWINDEYLRLYSNEFETILNKEAEVIFPVERAEVIKFKDYWIKNKEGNIIILDANLNSFFENSFQDFKEKDGVLALKKDRGWAVFQNGLQSYPQFEYDSIRIFNSWLTYATKDSAQYLLFQSGRKVQLAEKEQFKLLMNYNIELSPESNNIRFVELINEKAYTRLFNGFGRKIKEGQDLDNNVLTAHLVQIQKGKEKILIDSAANTIAVGKVNAFGAYHNGLIPFLRDKKFGAVSVDSLKVIPPHSQSKLEVYVKDSLYIFKEEGLFGISNQNGETVLNPDFEAIEYLNDSVAIVQEEGEIGIINIFQNEYLLDEIDIWKKVEFENQAFYIVRQSTGYGVLNQKAEKIIPFIFNELNPYNSKGELFWIAERRLSEINYIVIAYFDKEGKVLFKEGLNFDDYLETACD